MIFIPTRKSDNCIQELVCTNLDLCKSQNQEKQIFTYSNDTNIYRMNFE
jgi:hypothetical protein